MNSISDSKNQTLIWLSKDKKIIKLHPKTQLWFKHNLNVNLSSDQSILEWFPFLTEAYANLKNPFPFVIRHMVNQTIYTFYLAQTAAELNSEGFVLLVGHDPHFNALEERIKMLEAVLNNSEEMIALINPQSELLFMNSASTNRIKKRTGHEPKPGDKYISLIRKNQRAMIAKVIQQLFNGEIDKYQNVIPVEQNDSFIYFESLIKPITRFNGIKSGLSIFVKDITETLTTQIALAESEGRLHRITESTLEGVWEYDMEKEKLYLSHLLKEIINYSGKDDLSEFMAYLKTITKPSIFRKRVKELLLNQSKSGTYSFEIKFNTAKNSDLWILVKYTVYSDVNGKILSISGIFMNISNLKEQELELIHAKERAEEMTRLKSSFIANMSHEVRTPLNGILGVSQVMEKMGLPDEANHYLELQKKSGFRLLETINNIISLSRLEARPDLKKLALVDLNDYIFKQIESFEILAQQKNIGFEFIPYTKELKVPINEHLFYQVFNNLLGNAIKFTDRGKITLRIDRLESEALFEIKDTGIGIKKENMDDIFESFVQESTGEDRHFEGSGLGLTIVKKYMDWIGGRIEVKSQKYKGSCFSLFLPLSITT